MTSFSLKQFGKTVALPALAGVVMLIAGCHSGPDAADTNAAPARTPAAASQSIGTQVTIDNFTFSPPTLTVAPGTKVTWVNHDDVPHTVTSNDKQFRSKPLDTDDQFSHVFTTPGTYAYFCSVHPHMTGKIIVKNVSSSSVSMLSCDTGVPPVLGTMCIERLWPF